MMKFYPNTNMFAKTIRISQASDNHGQLTEYLGRVDFEL